MITYIDIETVPGKYQQLAEIAKDRDPDQFGALSPWLCRVVCVGINDQAFAGEDEKSILVHVNQVLVSSSRIFTFNGRSFDLPVLYHRMLAHAIEPAMPLKKARFQKPWESDPHIDLMNELSWDGATRRPSLREVCIGWGLPDPKASFSGVSVADMVAKGEWFAIKQYCLGDVRALTQIRDRLVSCNVRK
jgi:predicted PolB exonuclease-like 3'-5' exonuclease